MSIPINCQPTECLPEFLARFKAAAALLVRNRVLRPDGCLSARWGGSFFIPVHGANLAQLSDADILEIDTESLQPKQPAAPADEYRLHAALYQARPDFNAVLHSTETACVTASALGKPVRPVLDDMAQLVGITLRCVACPPHPTPAELRRFVKAFARRNALLLKGNGALCASGDLADAYAVAMVTEKACKASVESQILGGAAVIPKAEALLMRIIYQKKYSKKQLTNK